MGVQCKLCFKSVLGGLVYSGPLVLKHKMPSVLTVHSAKTVDRYGSRVIGASIIPQIPTVSATRQAMFVCGGGVENSRQRAGGKVQYWLITTPGRALHERRCQ